MRLLFLGDIVGKTARISIAKNLVDIKKQLSLDFVLVNAENATSGLGLSVPHAKLLFEAGVNCISLGDHAFDQSEMIQYIENESRIVRPINFAKDAPSLIVAPVHSHIGSQASKLKNKIPIMILPFTLRSESTVNPSLI